eukprot:780969-Amphidinium_carterae.1
MEAASAHPLFTRDPTIDTTQHSSPADPFSRTLVHTSADEENNFDEHGCLMPTALDSQLQTTQDEDMCIDVE